MGCENAKWKSGKRLRPEISWWKILLTICLLVFPLETAADESENISSGDLEEVVLQLKWYHQFQSAGYYAAIEKGYYHDAGLDVKILEGGQFDTVAKVLSSEANYAISQTDLLIQRLQGKPLVVLAAIFQHSPHALMVRKDSDIHDLHDLVARRVWMTRKTRGAELHAMFQSEGVPLERIQALMDTMTGVDYFDQTIDAFNVYITNEPFYLEQKNIPVFFIRPRTYGIDFYGDCLYTSAAELEKHPDRVKRFRKASLMGWKYAMQNPEEIIDVILAKYGSKMTREHLQYEASKMRDLVMPDLIEMGHMNPGRWRHIADKYAKLGMIETGHSLEGFIYNPNAESDHIWTYWLITSLLLLAAVASIILWFFNRRLKVVVLRRTSELAKSNEALQESEELYRNLYETMAQGVVYLSAEGEITSANPAAERVLGLTSDQLHGRTAFDPRWRAIHEDGSDFPGETHPVTVALKTGKEVNDVIMGVYNPEHQEYRWILINAVPKFRQDEDKPCEVYATFDDITDLRRAEEEILKSQKLESVGVLAGGIAHDFNNLLTGILGNISLAEMYEETGKPSSEVLERLKAAEEACMRSKDLAQQLLTFANGGAPIRKTASIAELLRDSATLVSSGSNIICKFSIPEDLWSVEIDEGQMNQVIGNIVINANQAMASGGIVEVNAENISVSAEDGLLLKDGKYVKVSIEDHGLGIPEADLPKIFDPYFTTKQTGSGLGLAICYSIVNKHGGYITVESRIGIGTTFCIYLPACLEEASIAAESREKSMPVPGEGSVLLMDDEQIVREIAGDMLRDFGYSVAVAANSSETIELYKSAMGSAHTFDVVILDLTIPGGIGGKETIQKLIEIDPEVKAIVSSGYSNNPVMTDFRKYGFKGVMAKPYKAVELSEVLHNVIAGA